jgi:hypothetical protein
MNGPIVGRAAEHLADALLEDAGMSDCDRLQRACRRILGRAATPEDVSQWRSFLGRYQSAKSLAGEGPERRRRIAWQGLCRALLSSNEFVYVE